MQLQYKLEDILGRKVSFVYKCDGTFVEEAILLKWKHGLIVVCSNNQGMDGGDRGDLYPPHPEYKYRWYLSSGQVLHDLSNLRPLRKFNHEA